MRKIENTTRRQITFSKRKSSLIRKTNEISILCDVDVALLTYSPSGRLNKFCNRDSSQTKNLKAKLEKLQMLDFIGDDDNKLDYLNDREYDIRSYMEPSLDQLLKCEKNLKNSLRLVMDRKTELLRELIHPNGQSNANKTQHEVQVGMETTNCGQQFENTFDKKELNSQIQKSTDGQLIMQLDPQNITNRLKISESGFQDIINGAMNQLGASQFQIHPTYTSQSKSKVSENIFQNTIDEFINQLEASASTSNFQIRPSYSLQSKSKASESIFHYTMDGSMGQLGASTSTSQFQIHPTISEVSEHTFQNTINGSMSQLGASTSFSQFQIHPSYAPLSISKVSESNFQNTTNGSMSQLGASTPMSQFQIPRPTYTPSSISKASESIFQDTIDGSMSQLGASASALQARIPPTYVPPSISNVHENIFQDPIDGSMSQLGASTSTSNFLLPLASASPSMYQLRAPSPTPQFQISPAYTPMQETMVRNQIVQRPQNQQVGVLNNSSMGQFGHDASYGIQQQYSTPTLGNHENNPNRQDGVISTFQFNTNMGKVNEFNISINHYPSLNSNVGVPSTSQRICSSMVCDPSFTTTTIANLSNDNGCFDANEKYPGIADEVDTKLYHLQMAVLMGM
ncbi:MADS-box protein SVP [Vitis vinifera]|uniref:MADS-box protein SVP n=1 Tax=Vitis vinifera TaxID=29760 RepID=A0A438FGX0_VITVI|nr:MADS-box protein SVP [Vitis vinifera]